MGTNELPQACGIPFSLTNRHPGIIYCSTLKETKHSCDATAAINISRNISKKKGGWHPFLQYELTAARIHIVKFAGLCCPYVGLLQEVPESKRTHEHFHPQSWQEILNLCSHISPYSGWTGSCLCFCISLLFYNFTGSNFCVLRPEEKNNLPHNFMWLEGKKSNDRPEEQIYF